MQPRPAAFARRNASALRTSERDCVFVFPIMENCKDKFLAMNHLQNFSGLQNEQKSQPAAMKWNSMPRSAIGQEAMGTCLANTWQRADAISCLAHIRVEPQFVVVIMRHLPEASSIQRYIVW